MPDYEASEIIQPKNNIKNNKSSKKELYLWPVIIMFALVAFLCINNYILLQSYKEVRNKLANANNKIHLVNSAKTDLINVLDELKKQNGLLSDENLNLKDKYQKSNNENYNINKKLEDINNKYDNLIKQNQELVDDNISLQNSLKAAASIGIRPQHYSIFETLKPRNSINKGEYVGKFIGTAYTPSKDECGNNKGITNSGRPIIPGVTIAVDTKYWPFGTLFYIKGLGYTVAMDTGSAIKGKYRFDFSVLDKKFANQLGVRKWDVYLVKLGSGYVKDIKL